jgi:hypothetical protein
MEMEKRIHKDANGFYNVQIRFLPLESWEPGDGWRTVYITSILQSAEARLGTEPGKGV